jgi:uncharacterized protein (DUF4415 family)
MAKKSSKSSQPVRLKNMTSEDIKNRKWTKAEIETVRRIARQQAAGDDSGVNFEGIPRVSELTPEQLASMIRFRERHSKTLVSVRLDQEVLEWLKAKGPGHLTRINDILANLMEAERRHHPK